MYQLSCNLVYYCDSGRLVVYFWFQVFKFKKVINRVVMFLVLSGNKGWAGIFSSIFIYLCWMIFRFFSFFGICMLLSYCFFLSIQSLQVLVLLNILYRVRVFCSVCFFSRVSFVIFLYRFLMFDSLFFIFGDFVCFWGRALVCLCSVLMVGLQLAIFFVIFLCFLIRDCVEYSSWFILLLETILRMFSI